MAQRQSITGRRSCVLYVVILVALTLIVAGIGLVLVIRPELERRRQAEVRLEQAETHYEAGIAFQNVNDWETAEAEFKQVIILDPDYKDVQTRLAEVKAKLAESAAAATAEVQVTATAQAEATAEAQANARATAVAAPAATAEVLEAHYQKGLGYVNMARWDEAKAELEQVFEVSPNYKDVQAKLAEVEVKLAETPTLPPTATSTATPKPTLPPSPTVTNTPVPVSIVTNGDFERPDAGSGFVVYKAGQTFDGWTVESGSVDHIGRFWPAARGKQSVDLNGTTNEAGTIYQNLPTVPGQSYVLRFAKGGNPQGKPAVKQMEVWWDDNLVDTLTVDTTGWKVNTIAWEYREYIVVAPGSTTRLRFKSLTEGNFGPVLDDVSVVPKGS